MNSFDEMCSNIEASETQTEEEQESTKENKQGDSVTYKTENLDENISPKKIVNTIFVIAGAIHPKAKIDISQCDVVAFIGFAFWLNSALPYSRTGKYQRIKQYKACETPGCMINTRNICHHAKKNN